MGRIALFAAALLALLGTASTAQQAPTAPSLSPAPTPAAAAPLKIPASPAARSLDRADVDAWLDGFMPYALRNGDIAGAVVVVVKDGQVLTQRGFGYADVAKRTPVDPDRTLFRPGSVSKLITWTAVMQQVEAGKIDLDADINRYLDFKIPPRDGKPVTMRQLMTHTAGFEERIKEIMLTDPKQLPSLRDYVSAWVPKRIFAPGTTPAYSNYATALAGYIVARVTGQSFDDYVDARVFAPLGMANSTFRQPLPAKLSAQMSRGYARASEKAKGFELVGPAPAGSMAASGADMGRFMIAHLNGGAGLMSAATARQMHDTPTNILPPLNRMELGFFETNVNGRQVIAHLGDTQWFHSALHLFMAEKTGIYLSVNSPGREGAAGAVRAALFNDFADRYFPGGAKDGRVSAEDAAEHARMMTGVWQASRRGESGVFKALGFFGQTKVGVDDKGQLVIPSLKDAGGAVRKWVEIAPFVWREAHGKERLAAQVVDGKVVRWSFDMVSPFTVWDRVPGGMSSAWLMPLLIASLVILLLTFLYWPVSALVRRHYKTPLALEGRARHVYRGLRVASGLTLAVLIGWALVVTALFADLSKLTAQSDGTLWFLQIAGLIVFLALAALAGWNLWLAFRDRRRWTQKLWAVLVAIAALTVLYFAVAFGLLDMTVSF